MFGREAGIAHDRKVPAVPAEGTREALPERYALVFADPDAGNVYDVMRTPGKGYRADPADRRLWAVLRLMGTTVGDEKRAAAVMADLYRARAVLGSARDEPRFTVRLTAVRKGETWADPAVRYTGTFVGAGLHLSLTVDAKDFVGSWPGSGRRDQAAARRPTGRNSGEVQ